MQNILHPCFSDGLYCSIFEKTIPVHSLHAVTIDNFPVWSVLLYWKLMTFVTVVYES